MLLPSIDYQGIVRDLKTRLLRVNRNDPAVQQACERMCRRLTPLLEMERDVSLEALIDQLEAKWRSDGLIGSEKD